MFLENLSNADKEWVVFCLQFLLKFGFTPGNAQKNLDHLTQMLVRWAILDQILIFCHFSQKYPLQETNEIFEAMIL